MSTFLVGKTSAHWSEQSGLKTTYFAEIDSTNTQAKSAGFPGEISLFFAENQVAGRGRGQNTWQNKAGDALLSSWVFPLPVMPSPVVTPLLGLALFTAVKATWGSLPWSLKAPNDLFLGDRKAAGLLVEVVSQGSQVMIVVGLGLNVFSAPDLATACSLRENFATPVLDSALSRKTWTHFLDRLLLEFTTCLANLTPEMNPLQRQNLLHILNQMPLITEKYQDVLADGSLKKASGLTPWQNL